MVKLILLGLLLVLSCATPPPSPPDAPPAPIEESVPIEDENAVFELLCYQKCKYIYRDDIALCVNFDKTIDNECMQAVVVTVKGCLDYCVGEFKKAREKEGQQ